MNTITSFSELVIKHFYYLVTEYNFKIQERSEHSDNLLTVDFVSDAIIVRVGKDRERIFVLLKPSGEPEIAQLSLLRVLEALAVISEKDFPGTVYPEIYDQVLEKYAKWLKGNCDFLLKGDIAQWSTILTIVLTKIRGDYKSRQGADVLMDPYQELQDYIVKKNLGG